MPNPKNLKKTDVKPKSDTKQRWWRRVYASRWRIPILIVLALVIALSSYYLSIRSRVVVAREGDMAGALSAYRETDFSLDQLKKDGDARVNILLLGKGGAGHDGGNLTDSIQLLSVDIFNNKVGVVGIPRDLYVESAGGASKINAVYSAAESKQKGSGGKAIKDVVGAITDTTVHYFALIDFSGLTEIVDAIGGIDIVVPKAINDSEYPAEDGTDSYTTFTLSAGPKHMDGELALKYVRSRHSTSDFDRLSRQQQVISAVKDKALSAGIVTSPAKLTRLMEALADSLRTDMTPREVTLMFERVSRIENGSIDSIVLGNGGFGSLNVLTSLRNSGLGSVQQPILGQTTYTDIQRAWHKIIPDPLVKKEAAKLRVQYVSAKNKSAAQKLADLLTDYGYNITSVIASNEKVADKELRVYRGDNHKYTVHFLRERLEIEPVTERNNDNSVDIDIIFP